MSNSFTLHSGLDDIPAALTGCVCAIGNFDGVHRGHQAVLQEACDLADKMQTRAIMLSFEPHPRSLFQPDSPVFRLSNQREKEALAQAGGLDGIIITAFDRAFASLSAQEFVSGILVDQLNVRATMTGYDFHFGKNRSGNPAYLRDAGAKLGFEAIIVEKFADEGNDAISSSRIRTLLSDGHIEDANGLLGYRWFVDREVVHGAKRGRTLGFPTANMELAADCALAHGIYAVRVKLADNSLHCGVASYGRRPQFDNGAALLETYLPGFDGDLYGQQARVQFLSRLRGEEKFVSVDALIAQMQRDTDEAIALHQSLDFGTLIDQRLFASG